MDYIPLHPVHLAIFPACHSFIFSIFCLPTTRISAAIQQWIKRVGKTFKKKSLYDVFPPSPLRLTKNGSVPLPIGGGKQLSEISRLQGLIWRMSSPLPLRSAILSLFSFPPMFFLLYLFASFFSFSISWTPNKKSKTLGAFIAFHNLYFHSFRLNFQLTTVKLSIFTVTGCHQLKNEKIWSCETKYSSKLK